MLVTAMLVQLEEGLLALSGLFSELYPLGKRGEIFTPLDSLNFAEIYLFPEPSNLFSERSTLGVELSLWLQTDLFLYDPLLNAVSKISLDLNSIRCCPFFENPCLLNY